MTYLFIDEWGNIYYSNELTGTAKKQIDEGILSAIKINADLKQSDISVNSPDDEDQWEDVIEYTESSAKELEDDDDIEDSDDYEANNLIDKLEEE